MALFLLHIAAYLDVRNDKSETTWLLLDYESDRSDKLKLSQTGAGGLEELTNVLDDGKAQFAYARVTYSNDKESKREKFILVVRLYPAPRRRKSSTGSMFFPIRCGLVLAAR